MPQEVTLNELIAYYEDVFVKAYADLVALTADKPAQVLVEIENFNSHLIVILKNESSDKVNSNSRKAKTHLQRGTLDCYKMLFVSMHNMVQNFLRDMSIEDVQFVLGDKYTQCINDWFSFSQKIRETRRLEVANTGSAQLDQVIAEYKSAVEAGYAVYELILKSAPKIAHVRKHLFWHSFKTHWPYHIAEIAVVSCLALFFHHLAVS